MIIALAALYARRTPPHVGARARRGGGRGGRRRRGPAGGDLAQPSWSARGARRRALVAYRGRRGAAADRRRVGRARAARLRAAGARCVADRVDAPRCRAPVAARGHRRCGPCALAWTALKVGALTYGGGFVIVPLMQGDAVDRHGWMTHGEFLNAVALGQITPGPVTQTSAVSGTPPPGWRARSSPPRSRSAPRSPSCSAAGAFLRCARTSTRAPSSTAPGRPRSARSPARSSRSRAGSTSRGSGRSPPSRRSCCWRCGWASRR